MLAGCVLLFFLGGHGQAVRNRNPGSRELLWGWERYVLVLYRKRPGRDSRGEATIRGRVAFDRAT